jgi:outer membrane protein TolC
MDWPNAAPDSNNRKEGRMFRFVKTSQHKRASQRIAHSRAAGLQVLLVIGVCSAALAQQLPQAPSPGVPPPQFSFHPSGPARWLFSPYRAPAVGPSSSDDSSLLASLIQDGKLRLTLQDAIALAVQNNFDVELQRYNWGFAATELLRTKGGGLLRGMPTTVNELPAGEGGPGEPLLTTVGGYSPVLQLPSSAADLATITETQSDLTVLNPLNLSPGSSIPQFDPALAASFSLTQIDYSQADTNQTGSNFFSSHSLSGGTTYTHGFATGTQLNASYTSTRIAEQSTRVNLNPFISGALSVTLTQPLLQGFGIGMNRRFIRIARNESRIAKDVFEQQLISTISDTIRLYWDLVSLQGDLEVKRESLDAADRLYQDTKNEVEQGTQAPVDLTSSMAQVASDRQAYINEEGMVMQQELLLKEVLTRKGISNPALAAANIVAVTPIDIPGADSSEPLDGLIGKAMKQRPDLALANVQDADAKLSLKGSRNALLPQLNLVASMQNNGDVGTAVTEVPLVPGATSIAAPASLTSGYGSLLGQVFGRDYPDYSVGAQLNLPIRNRIAKADVARDELQYRQSQVRVLQLQSDIRLQVGNAFIAVQQARESYKAAVDARVLQEQALDVERSKFEAGVATAFEIIQYQSLVAEARSAQVTALGVYAKAVTALQRAVGSTLTDNGVVLDDALVNRIDRSAAQPAIH